MAWSASVGAHWNKIEAEYNAEWAKLAYLDGPGYTAWGRIEAKFDLRRKYFSGSSSRGVQNSIKKAMIQSCSSHLISSMAESNREHSSCMAETAREIENTVKLLQEEMEATKSTSDVVPTSDEILLSVEGIDEHSVTDESVQLKNLIMTLVSPSIDFNGGVVNLPEETTQKLRKTPKSCVGSKLDVKITFADSFISKHLVVDSNVESDCYSTKVTPLDMDRKQNNSPVVINQGVFNPSNHLSDPPDLVPVPPPPLAPPWLQHLVYPRQLDSPPLTIESNNSFQLDQEVLTRIPSQIDNSITFQVINMLRKISVRDTSVISNVILLSLYACHIVSGLSGFGPSVSYTYQLFVERPLKITFFWNIVLFQYMITNSTRLQISVPQQIKLFLDNVLIACDTFESLLLGTQSLSYVVQLCGAISLKCKKFGFGYCIGSAFKLSVFTLCLAKLVGNELLIGKQTMVRIVSFLSQLCRSSIFIHNKQFHFIIKDGLQELGTLESGDIELVYCTLYQYLVRKFEADMLSLLGDCGYLLVYHRVLPQLSPLARHSIEVFSRFEIWPWALSDSAFYAPIVFSSEPMESLQGVDEQERKFTSIIENAELGRWVTCALLNLAVIGLVYEVFSASRKGGKTRLSQDDHTPYDFHEIIFTTTQLHHSNNSTNDNLLVPFTLVYDFQKDVYKMLMFVVIFQLQQGKCAIILYLANILLVDTPKVEREGTHFFVLVISNKALLLESNVGGEYNKSSYCPQLLDFNVLVETMDSCVLPSYHFAIPFNSSSMISTSLTLEYIQMTMKGKHSIEFDSGGTGFFFLPTKTLLFQQWDSGGWSSSLGSAILLVLEASWSVLLTSTLRTRLILMGGVML